MGAGKSLISKKLAQKLNFPVFSTDKLIEEKEGRSISNIFQSSTETYFRKVEKEIVLKVSEQENVIIDFKEVLVLTPSWADEFLTPLLSRFKDKVTLIHTDNASVHATLKILSK